MEASGVWSTLSVRGRVCWLSLFSDKRHGQLVVPARLLCRRGVRIGRTGVWNHEYAGAADAPRLWAEDRLGCCRLQSRVDVAETGDAMKAGDAGLVAFELGHQLRDARRSSPGSSWCARAVERLTRSV